jgi:hypothetical protein
MWTYSHDLPYFHRTPALPKARSSADPGDLNGHFATATVLSDTEGNNQSHMDHQL